MRAVLVSLVLSGCLGVPIADIGALDPVTATPDLQALDTAAHDADEAPAVSSHVEPFFGLDCEVLDRPNWDLGTLCDGERCDLMLLKPSCAFLSNPRGNPHICLALDQSGSWTRCEEAWAERHRTDVPEQLWAEIEAALGIDISSAALAPPELDACMAKHLQPVPYMVVSDAGLAFNTLVIEHAACASTNTEGAWGGGRAVSWARAPVYPSCVEPLREAGWEIVRDGPLDYAMTPFTLDVVFTGFLADLPGPRD